MNNPNRQNSPGYCKWKPRTVTFTTDTIQCGNGHVPNLQNKGPKANNEHLSKKITWRCMAKITLIRKPGILNCKAVIEYTKMSNSNIFDRWDKELQDKTNQMWSLNMMPIHKFNLKWCAIDAEQPLDQRGTTSGPPWTTSPSRGGNDMSSSVLAVTGAMILLDQPKPPSLPEIMGMEELEQETKTLAV